MRRGAFPIGPSREEGGGLTVFSRYATQGCRSRRWKGEEEGCRDQEVCQGAFPRSLLVPLAPS